MNRSTRSKIHSFLIIPFFLGMSFPILAQQSVFQGENYDNAKKWKFGGGFGLGFGSGYTDIMIAPSALYEVNPYVAVGVGLQGSYINSKNRSYYNTNVQEYSSWIYGGSAIAISNPIPQLQLSAELEQLRVNNSYKLKDGYKVNDDFWNTALFLGVGYNQGPVTIGLRYNVLYKEKDMVYGSAYMPFVRVYF